MVWATLASFCVALFVALAPLFVLGPIVAREHYGDLAVFGYVFAAFGGGTIIGSLVGFRWRPRYPMRQAMTLILVWPFAIALYDAIVAFALGLLPREMRMLERLDSAPAAVAPPATPPHVPVG